MRQIGKPKHIEQMDHQRALVLLDAERVVASHVVMLRDVLKHPHEPSANVQKTCAFSLDRFATVIPNSGASTWRLLPHNHEELGMIKAEGR